MVYVWIGHRLLGRHVSRRADRHPHRGHHVAAGSVAHRLGHAEIGHQRMTLREHHVVRLDVAVHHPQLVRMRQRVDHLGDEPHRLVHRQRAFARDALAQ